MLNEGPVYTRITSSLREAGPSFCLSYYEPIRPPASPIAIVGVSFEYSVCIHIKPDNTLRASPVLAATTLPGRRQAGLFRILLVKLSEKCFEHAPGANSVRIERVKWAKRFLSA